MIGIQSYNRRVWGTLSLALKHTRHKRSNSSLCDIILLQVLPPSLNILPILCVYPKKFVTVAHGLKCKCGGRGKNGPTQWGSHYLNVRRRNRQKENGRTEDQMSRHVQEVSRSTMVTSSQKPERMAYIHTTFVEPSLREPRTQAASGYTSVFNDARTKYKTEVK